MFQRKAGRYIALVAIIIGICIAIVFVLLKSRSGTIKGTVSETNTVAISNEETRPPVIRSNMIDLNYRELFKLDIAKTGGGIGATDSELIVVTGDGQLRVVDLTSGENFPSAIQLPLNNEEAAIIAARQVEDKGRAKQGEDEVKKWFRYDDILVFDDEQSLNLVLSYAYFDPEELCFSHRVSALSVPLHFRLKDLSASPDDWSLIFSSQPCFGYRSSRHSYAGVQSGGRLAALDKLKGEVLLALGDYEFDGFKVPRYPQNPDADYGKIWKFNIHNKTKEILSIGHRNTQGITVDSEGRIWTAEQGPQGGDELNLIVKGENYGWPDVTLGIQYETKPWPLNKAQGRHDGFKPPVFVWVPSAAISNIDQSINFHPFWEGDLLAFSLKGQSIFRLRLDGDHVIMSEPIPFNNERLRYGLNHQPTGALYLWTDSGTLYQVAPSRQAWGLVERGRKSYEAVRQGLEISESPGSEILGDCLVCHSGTASSAPDLAGILGRKIGSSAYINYSPALSGKNQTWNRENLREFLKNPQRFASGTTMPDPMINDDAKLNEILDALEKPGAEPTSSSPSMTE